MRRYGITIILSLLAVWSATDRDASAQSAGAKSSGNWNDPTIWTTGTVPGASTNVYIGSTAPNGAAATATVTLTQAESTSNVSLGYGTGTNGALNLGSNSLTVSGMLSLGSSSGGIGSIQEASGGSFTAVAVDIYGTNSLIFGANDQTDNLSLTGGSTATTTAAGNVTGHATVAAGSTLSLGANTTLSGANGGLNVQDKGSVLNMGGHSVNATSIDLGSSGTAPVTILNQGNITTGNLSVGNGMTYNLLAGDKVGGFRLNDATSTLNSSVSSLALVNGAAATTTAGNVTGEVNVESGSTLNLGADLKLGYVSGGIFALNVEDKGSVLNMNGHAIIAAGDSLAVGYNGTAPVTILNQGNITAASLSVGNGTTYNLLAGDHVGIFNLSGGSSTLNGSVTNLNLSNGATASTIAGPPMTLSGVSLDSSTLTLHGGDVISNSINLTSNSLLTVLETNGTGLTFDGTSAGSLSIDPSHIDVNFTATGWDFRWKDPSSGGNWISTIDSLISSGEMVINLPSGFQYEVVDQGGYTYVKAFGAASVPEPSSLLLVAIGGAGLLARWTWQRKRRGR